MRKHAERSAGKGVPPEPGICKGAAASPLARDAQTDFGSAISAAARSIPGTGAGFQVTNYTRKFLLWV